MPANTPSWFWFAVGVLVLLAIFFLLGGRINVDI